MADHKHVIVYLQCLKCQLNQFGGLFLSEMFHIENNQQIKKYVEYVKKSQKSVTFPEVADVNRNCH
jgi:hypothetical protein